MELKLHRKEPGGYAMWVLIAPSGIEISGEVCSAQQQRVLIAPSGIEIKTICVTDAFGELF